MKMARPRKKETLIQTSFRLPASDLARIQEAADEMGMGTSEFIRMAVVYAARDPKVDALGMQIAQMANVLMAGCQPISRKAPEPRQRTQNIVL